MITPLAIRAWVRYDVVSRVIDRLNPGRVLEIGCGQGAFGARIASRVDYLGVEPYESSYAVAASRIESRGGKMLKGIHETVPAGTVFDAVCAFEVLEHLDDDKGSLAAWVPFIGPGGHRIMSVPTFQDGFGPMDTHAEHFRRYSPTSCATVSPRRVWKPRRSLSTAGRSETRWKPCVTGSMPEARDSQGERHLDRGLTAASGRTFQPSTRSAGIAAQAAILPFRYLPRAQTHRGTGLVAVAARPAG